LLVMELLLKIILPCLYLKVLN